MTVEYLITDKRDKTKVVISLSDYKKLLAKAEELDEIKAHISKEQKIEKN